MKKYIYLSFIILFFFPLASNAAFLFCFDGNNCPKKVECPAGFQITGGSGYEDVTLCRLVPSPTPVPPPLTNCPSGYATQSSNVDGKVICLPKTQTESQPAISPNTTSTQVIQPTTPVTIITNTANEELSNLQSQNVILRSQVDSLTQQVNILNERINQILKNQSASNNSQPVLQSSIEKTIKSETIKNLPVVSSEHINVENKSENTISPELTNNEINNKNIPVKRSFWSRAIGIFGFKI